MKNGIKLAVFSTMALLSCASFGADMIKAKQNYDRLCAACHGFNGMSAMPDAPNLRLNQGLMQSGQEIVRKLKSGSTRKPPFVGMLSDQELLDIVGYVRTIR